MLLTELIKGLDSVDAPVTSGCGTSKTHAANTGCC